MVTLTTVTLKCGGDPYSTHYRSFHALTTSNTILKEAHKNFWGPEAIGIQSKFDCET